MAVGTSSGFALAITIFQWNLGRKLVSVVLETWEIIPPLIAIPIAFSLMGSSWVAQFLAGSFYAFVASAVLTMGALQNVPHSYVFLAKLGGANRWWIAWHVYAPSVLVQNLSSLKSVGAFTLGIVIVLEYLAAPSGIGRAMKYALSYNSIELLMTGVVWAVLIGFAFDLVIDLLHKRCLLWIPREV